MQDGRPASGTSSVTLSIEADLLEQARQVGIDLAVVVDCALRSEIARRRRWQQWRTGNRAAIEASNAELERHGLWADDYRTW